MYQVFQSPFVPPHPCNVPITGDGGKTYRGGADNFSMCKISREPVTITDVLETSYA